jgi:hypothetical protein
METQEELAVDLLAENTWNSTRAPTMQPLQPVSKKRRCLGCPSYDQHWSSLSVRQRRTAEEAAIENWDHPDLLEFGRRLRELAALKRHLMSEWCTFVSPNCVKTGLVISIDLMGVLFEGAVDVNGVLSRLHQFLFQTQEYSRYVLEVASEICLSDPSSLLAVQAFRIAVIPHLLVHGFPKTIVKHLACVCKAFQRSYERHRGANESRTVS